jgi:MoaA/NifB/PqqE/SkfB family radical SAM enzyme
MGIQIIKSRNKIDSEPLQEIPSIKPKRNTFGSLLSAIRNGHANPQLVIQYTTFCNATCPQCGMRKNSKINRVVLEKDYIKRVIDHAVSKWNIQFLSFTGGEPFLFIDDIIELISYATSMGVKYVRTGTNGFVFQYNPSRADDFERKSRSLIEKLSETRLYTLWISLDSSDSQTHEQMRGFDGLVKGIEKAIRIFEEYGMYPAVNLGLNRNIAGNYSKDEIANFDKEKFYERYRNGISKFYQLAIDMGFTMANTCYPMSMEDGSYSYHATSHNDIVSFRPEEKAVLFKALYDSASEYRSKIRIFTPRSSLRSLIDFYNDGKKIEYPCRGGIDYFYLDAQNGHVFPCGYRVEDDFGEIWDVELNELRESRPNCTKCDWECFRDPTELIQPMIDLYQHPFPDLFGIFTSNKKRLWLKDLLYFYACDFFNLRSKPSYPKMKLLSH